MSTIEQREAGEREYSAAHAVADANRPKRDPMAGLTSLERELFSALDRLLSQCDRLRLPGQSESDAEKSARAAKTKAEVIGAICPN